MPLCMASSVVVGSGLSGRWAREIGTTDYATTRGKGIGKVPAGLAIRQSTKASPHSSLEKRRSILYMFGLPVGQVCAHLRHATASIERIYHDRQRIRKNLINQEFARR